MCTATPTEMVALSALSRRYGTEFVFFPTALVYRSCYGAAGGQQGLIPGQDTWKQVPSMIRYTL